MVPGFHRSLGNSVAKLVAVWTSRMLSVSSVNACRREGTCECENADLQFHAALGRVAHNKFIYFIKALLSNMVVSWGLTRFTCLSYPL